MNDANRILVVYSNTNVICYTQGSCTYTYTHKMSKCEQITRSTAHTLKTASCGKKMTTYIK